MRPRRFAAENDAKLETELTDILSFNEAAAIRRGEPSFHAP